MRIQISTKESVLDDILLGLTITDIALLKYVYLGKYGQTKGLVAHIKGDLSGSVEEC
jgi:hypothetical protein